MIAKEIKDRKQSQISMMYGKPVNDKLNGFLYKIYL